MTIAAVASFILFVMSLAVHFLALRLISSQLPECGQCRPYLVLFALVGILFAHLAEIALYALAFDWLSAGAQVGGLAGQQDASFMDYFYYSAVMYTSLGIGDVYPLEHLRIISGLETLNGLLLIGWTTSFTFLMMRRYWFQENH